MLRKYIFIIAVMLLSAGLFAPAAAQEDGQTEVIFENIRFVYDDVLADDVEFTVYEATEPEPGMPFWALTPEYVEFTFQGYQDEGETLQNARLMVYDAPAFAEYGEDEFTLYDNQQQLRALINEYADARNNDEEPPELGRYIGASLRADDEPLPFVPLFNAAQVLRIQPVYLEFEDGVGIRYITYYAQAASPLQSTDLFYTFQGLTNDGRYYISAIFPLRTDQLPESIDFENFDFDAFAENYTRYIQNVAETIQAENPADFTPGLGELDAIIESIVIE